MSVGVAEVHLHAPEQLQVCQASRIRQGREEPCHDEAVALALAGDMVYPVCAFHTRTMTALTLGEAMRHGWLS